MLGCGFQIIIMAFRMLPFSAQDAPFSAQDAPYSAQDAFTYDFDDASMTHSITAEEGMLLGAPPPPQD